MNKSNIYPSYLFPEGYKLFHKFSFYKDKKYCIYSLKKTNLKEHLYSMVFGILLLLLTFRIKIKELDNIEMRLILYALNIFALADSVIYSEKIFVNLYIFNLFMI